MILCWYVVSARTDDTGRCDEKTIVWAMLEGDGRAGFLVTGLQQYFKMYVGTSVNQGQRVVVHVTIAGLVPVFMLLRVRCVPSVRATCSVRELI